jgi:hypothetical protein
MPPAWCRMQATRARQPGLGAGIIAHSESVARVQGRRGRAERRLFRIDGLPCGARSQSQQTLRRAQPCHQAPQPTPLGARSMANDGERWRTMRCGAVLAATLPAVSGRRRAANTRCAPIIAPPARCPEGCFTSFEPPNAARVPSIRLALARTPKACGIGQGSRSCAGVSAAQQGALAQALHAGGVAASHS